MNYQAAANLGYNRQGIPIGTDWRRVNYALAGYGLVLPATISDAKVVDLVPGSEQKTQVVLSSRGN